MSSTTEETILKVASSSDPKKVASAILNCIFTSSYYPPLRAIGHGAVGQAVKAVAIARGSAATQGVNLAVQIGFKTILNKQGEEVSSIVLQTFDRG